METSIKCIKYTLFLFNLLFTLSGLFLIVVGGVVQGAYSQYLDFLGDQFFSTPVFLVIVGCIIFFVAFFGCCGAIKENHCMTLAFAILLGIIFLMEVGAGIAAYKLKSQVKHLLETNMEKGMQNYNETGFDGVTHTWDIIQYELDCCGAQEYHDWNNVTFSNQHDVPDSCCLSSIVNCGKGVLDLSDTDAAMKIHTGGCLDIFATKIQDNVGVVGGVGIGIGLLQLIGMIFACYLANTIKKEYETV